MQALQQTKLEALSEFSLWDQFHHDFQLHSKNIQQLNDWAQSSMPVLHSQLLFFSLKYAQVLEKAENETIEKSNLVFTLTNTDLIRVNLIALKAGRNLPLHDHSDSAGSMMVISGDVHVISCEQGSSSSPISQTDEQLIISENKVFHSGESSCFTQTQHNIHSFKALTDRAVIMVIHTPPFSISQQSYFFTESSMQEIGSSVSSQKIRVQALQNFRTNKFKTLRNP